MPSLNVKRIESDIVKYIPMIIQKEANNELLKKITITGAKLAHDYSYCKIYFTSLIEDIPREKLEKEVNEASSFIRGKLASLIEARNIPVLHFTYDESVEYGNKIDQILNKINNK